MRTHIDNGWVVAFDGRSHQVYERGSVVFEDDRIVHAGPRYTGSADARIDAGGPAGLARVHQHPRAHHRQRRGLPAGRHGQERLPHLELHGLRGATQGQDGAAPATGGGRVTDVRVPPRAEKRHHHDHRRGRTARGLGWLRPAGRRSRRAGLRQPAVPRSRYVHGREGPAHVRRGRRRWPRAAEGGGRLREELRQDRAGAPARDAQRRPGGNLYRDAAARGPGRGARARRADSHARRRQPDRVPADHGRVPPYAHPVPGRHRLPRRPQPDRPRGHHGRPSVDAAIPSATTSACWPSGAPPSATARTSTPRWP